jgi:small-conductance mechanosensitive channel
MPPDLVSAFLPAWVPNWAVSLSLIAAALVAAVVLHALIVRALSRSLKKRGEFTRSLMVRTRAPSRFALVVAALSLSLKVTPVDPALAATLQHVLLVAFIVLVGWVLMTATDIAAAIYLRGHRSDVADTAHARKMLTQTRILRRSLNVLIIVVTTALALITIPGVKQIGVSLLAAGGAAGIILGLALQPVLSNIMAGIQIAFTQPIRINDAVVVQNEFGHVEEIKATYVVIRLRDLRRLVVPLRYFLEQPFQNWTRETSNLIAEVMLVLDQRVPLAQLRATVEVIARASPHWDGQIVKVQVNDVRERAMEIRCLVGARNADEATELRAEIREKVLDWLRAEMPEMLPRTGVELPGTTDQRIE